MKLFKRAGLAAALFVISVGCQKVDLGPARRIVEGNILFDKQPIDYGMIRFVPVPDGPVSTAMISHGKFRCDAHGGVPVGDVRVEIESMPNTSGMTEDEILAKGPPKAVVIPNKYNEHSELKQSIPSGKEQLNLDFSLDK